MPQFDIKLDDGRSIRVEGERPPTEDEASQIIQEQFADTQPKISGTKTFLQHAAAGVGPGAAFVAAAPIGAEAGGAIGSFGGPIGTGIGATIGGLVTGIPAAYAAGKAQSAVAKAVAPEFTQKFEAELAQGEQQHPIAAIGGDIASMGASAKMAPFKLAQIPFRVGVGTAVGAALPVITERRAPTPKDLITGAATGALYGEGRFKLLPKSMQAAAVATGEKGAPNAIPVRSAETVSMGETPGNRPTVEQGVSQPEAPAEAQSEAQAPGVQQQVLRLTPEDQAHIDAERGSVDVPVEVRAPTENEPFAQAKAGQIASIDRQKGTIVINPQEFSGWLNEDMRGLTPERKRLAVRSLLAEERNHLATSQEDAAGYWNSLSAAERLIEQKLYTTRFRGRPDVSPTDLGFEAIRRRMQRLARMDSTETAAAAGAERWGLKSLEALNDTIRGIRETLGTRASKEGLAILDKVQGNLDAARAAVGDQPASLRRGGEEERPQNLRAAWEAYDGTGEIHTVRDLADTVEGLILEGKAPESLQESLDEYRRELREDFEEYAGRSDMDEVEERFTDAVQRAANQEPASLRRKSEKETQTEFFLPPIKEGDVERPGATDVGAKPLETPAYLTPDKVNWERMERKGAIRERPFRPITDAEAANPKALSVILARGAREGGSNRLETQTKNVTALFDRYTGRIDVVSTYPHSRKGVMLADPSLLSENASRPHRQLEALLTRYKPIYSISLKEPVQNFHERFASMQDFQQRFGNAATEESAKRQGVAPTQAPAGAGRAAAFQAEQFTLPVETPAISPPESAEAGAIHDFFAGKVPKSNAEMQAMLTRGIGNEAGRRMASLLKKGVELEQARDPNISAEESVARAFDQIYENLTQASDRQDFIRRTLGRFAEQIPRNDERIAAGAQQTGQPAQQTTQSAQQVTRGTIPEGKLTKATGSEPASLRRLTQPVEDEFLGIINRAGAVMSRWEPKQKLSRLADGATSYGTMVSERSKRWIQNASATPRRLEGLRVQHGNAPVLQAARAVNASYQPVGPPPPTGAPATWAPNRALLAQFMQRLAAGEAKARQLIANPTPATLAAVGLDQITGVSSRQIAKIGRDWLAGIEKVRPEVEYANAHWGDTDLMQTTDRVREAFGEQLYRENQAGIDTREVPNYMPGLYEGEVWDDNGVHFGGTPSLGRMFGKPKSFPDVYSALENGPFIPKSMSVADSAYNRIRSGMNKIAERQAFNAAKGIIDPATGTPIAIDPVRGRDGEWTVPPGEEQRTLVRMYGQGKPLAVRKGYENTIRNLYSESAVPGWVGGKAALATSGLIKHAGILLYDTFHPGRLGDYALSIIGKKVGFNAAYNALEYTPKGLQEAVNKGLVPQSAADWALGREEVNIGGKRVMITRQKILEMGIRRGLNANRISDALFKHMADKVPGAGWYNRMLFDKFQRGLMGKVFVEEFTRLNQASPGTDAGKIIDRVVGDTNTFFGSLGRQSIIKNPTARDLSQMLLLAPQWLMGLVGKEASFLKRSVTAPYKLLTEGRTAANVEWGTIGKGIGRGLFAMFLLTQGINLLTRHKLTFQNEEEGHKMDAWLPSYDGAPGHWISPLSIFMEITHDLIRLVGTKPTVLEATRQIGENKLGPLGKAALVLGTGKGPTGEKSTTSMGNIKAAAEQLAPVPISLGRFGQAAGHALAPNLVPPTPPGSIQRQMLSSAGIKSEIADTATERISRLAQRFVDENGLRHTGFDFVPTDVADYAKVRMALQRGDNAGAQKLLKAIGKPDDHVIKVMRAWATRPYTSSKKAEEVFIKTLTPAQLEVYAEAQAERQELLQKFYNLMLSQ